MNIRSMPSTNSQVVSLIPFGDKFEIKEIGKKATLYGISSNWMKIQYKNIEGWEFIILRRIRLSFLFKRKFPVPTDRCLHVPQ